MGPERLPVQGQYPYQLGRDRQGPPQHTMMGSGPPTVSGGPGEGPQPNMWHPRTDMGYTYSRQGQGPPYPSVNRGDDQEGRAPQDNQWPPGHLNQRQPPFPPHSSSSSIPALEAFKITEFLFVISSSCSRNSLTGENSHKQHGEFVEICLLQLDDQGWAVTVDDNLWDSLTTFRPTATCVNIPYPLRTL